MRDSIHREIKKIGGGLQRLAERVWQLSKRYPKSAGTFLILFLIWMFCLPRQLFDSPTSMVLEDRQGNLLGARIAADGQWRFPAPDSIPSKFAQALLAFEDRRFYYHPGVDPISLSRAFVQNLRSGRVVSGGSTLTMQVVRLSRDNPPRTIWQKLIEMMMATRLEAAYRKKSILKLYAANAPFGGNVVGLEAASWRYFGKAPHLLSWAEAAMLAVLPNSPALIHPGRNRAALVAKRNRLLQRLYDDGRIDALTLELALVEPLPEAPHPLPRLAPHLLDRAFAEFVATGRLQTSRVRTTVEVAMQQQLTEVLSRYQQLFRYNEIHNLAGLVVDVETGQVLAYVGNVIGSGAEHGEEVDVIKAPRSTGSILKPFLYGMMLHEGQLLPNALVPDVPTILSGYRPENYKQQFDGLVTARRALVRSLNVPFVHLLQNYGLEKFHFKLRQMGLSTINRPPLHYGLPLVLGGAEGSLWDITNAYACLSRQLVHYPELDSRYDASDWRPLNYRMDVKPNLGKPSYLSKEPLAMGAAATWLTFEAMQEVERPNAEGEWEYFRSSRRVAWKTGTSFGFRDAWAVGVSPRFVVGIWVGNADGEGRPGLMGVLSAAPVLFDVFSRLPQENRWFPTPYDDMTKVSVCKESGYRNLAICPVDTIWAPRSGLKADACPYHQLVHLDPSRQWQVNSDCESPSRIIHEPWMVLPPLEEYYYKSLNPNFKPLPPLREDCLPVAGQIRLMQLIYPKQPTRIYVPTDLDGKPSRTVFAVAHRLPESTIYWHIDNEYIGQTRTFHSMELNPPVGKHLLTLVDERGNRLEQRFEIIVKGGN